MKVWDWAVLQEQIKEQTMQQINEDCVLNSIQWSLNQFPGYTLQLGDVNLCNEAKISFLTRVLCFSNKCNSTHTLVFQSFVSILRHFDGQSFERLLVWYRMSLCVWDKGYKVHIQVIKKHFLMVNWMWSAHSLWLTSDLSFKCLKLAQFIHLLRHMSHTRWLWLWLVDSCYILEIYFPALNPYYSPKRPTEGTIDCRRVPGAIWGSTLLTMGF